MNMGNVLISMDEKTEKDMRDLAKDLFGGRKGALSKTVAVAVEDLKKKSKKKKALKELLEVMKGGFDMGLNGKKVYEKRSELYDR